MLIRSVGLRRKALVKWIQVLLVRMQSESTVIGGLYVAVICCVSELSIRCVGAVIQSK